MMKRCPGKLAFRFAVFITLATVSAYGDDLKKDYFGTTQPGDSIEQELSSPDGSKSTYVSKRLPDENGRVVVELSVNVLAGPGAGSSSKNTIHLPKNFNFARDWLSYGRFVEKMLMEYGGTVMPIEGATLEAIRNSSKDYRGAVTYVGRETVDGYECDHYTYSLSIAGPIASKETGDLWLSDAIPFGIVRQAATTRNEDNSVVSSYEIFQTGKTKGTDGSASDSVPPIENENPDVPSIVNFSEGYESGLVALDITVVPGTGGQRLLLTLRNKTDRELTVKLTGGDQIISGSAPVNEVNVTIKESKEIVLPAESSSEPIIVIQRGTRGPVAGVFTLSYYEGTPLYSGTVTMGTLGR